MSGTETAKKSTDGLQIDKKTVIGITAILLAVYILVGALTYIIPRGEYNTFIDEKTGNASITSESVYTPLEDFKMPVWKIIAAPVLVFADASTRSTGFTGILIVVFIVLMGGTFLLLDRCGVLNYLVASIIKKFGAHRYLLMAVLLLFFMALASTAGTLEESVTFVPITVALALALGWDSLVGVSLSLVAVMFGFTAATFNPFNVMTVQKLAGDVEIYSGLGMRIAVFAAVFLVLFGFLALYARRIEKHPEKSLAYETDKALRDKYKIDNSEEVLKDAGAAKGARAFLICLSLAFVCIVLDFVISAGGVLSMGGIGVFFVLGGIIAGVSKGYRGKKLLSAFGEGVKTVAPILPLIILVIAIAYVLNTGKIMHTILYYVYNMLSGLSPSKAILLLFVFIALLEFFIGSGTAKAFLVMPLVIPLAHLIGISSNSVVLSFCLADGFTNMLYPTSGIMIIAIGLVGVSYPKWLRFAAPLLIAEGVVSVAFMLIAVNTGYC